MQSGTDAMVTHGASLYSFGTSKQLDGSIVIVLYQLVLRGMLMTEQNPVQASNEQIVSRVGETHKISQVEVPAEVRYHCKIDYYTCRPLKSHC